MTCITTEIKIAAKVCSKCNKEKPFSEYFKLKTGKYGFRPNCKKCHKEYMAQYYIENKNVIYEQKKIYNSDNKEKISEQRSVYYQYNSDKIKSGKKKYYSDNKEGISEKGKKYYASNKDYISNRNKKYYLNNKEKCTVTRREYYSNNRRRLCSEKREYSSNNREKLNKYFSERYKNDLNFRCESLLRRRLTRSLKNAKVKKHSNTMDLLGCDMIHFIAHIESQFIEGMSWNKFGRDGIHLDHIRPCVSFDLTDPEQQKECFNWRNVQPLWARDNHSKGSLYNGRRHYKRSA